MLSLNETRLVRSVWANGSGGSGTQVWPSVVLQTWPLFASAMQMALSSETVPTATKPSRRATTAFTCEAPSTGNLLINCQPAPPPGAPVVTLDGAGGPTNGGEDVGELTLGAAQPASTSKDTSEEARNP